MVKTKTLFSAALLLMTTITFGQACSGGFSALQGLNSSSSVDPNAELLAKGQKVYATNCQSCHGPLSESAKRNATLGDIKEAINTISQMQGLGSLTLEEIEAVSYALAPSGSAPAQESAVLQVRWDERKETTCKVDAIDTHGTLISAQQYRDIIKDLFNLDIDVSKFPSNPRHFYVENEGSPYAISDLFHLDKLMTTAEAVALSVSSDIANKAKAFSACNLSDSDAVKRAACEETVLQAIVSRLFRRVLDTSDPEYQRMKSKVSNSISFAERASKTITIALMMPQFLYRIEADTSLRAAGPLAQPTLRNLTDYELAERLSFMLWNSVPDQALLELAKAGRLKESAVFSAQVDRMIADPKINRFILTFADEWLDLQALSETTKGVPGYSPALMQKFRQESRLFVQDLFTSSRDFRQFFTSERTFVDSSLATHYGISSVSGTAYASAIRPQADLHAGFLSHGSFSALTTQDGSDTIFRGLYPARRFLCVSFGQPPPGATDIVIPGDTKFDVMQNCMRLRSCEGCHSVIEPIGYALEPLSVLGQFRTIDEQGDPVGVRAVKVYSSDLVATPRELGTVFSNNSQTGVCMSEMLLKYATRNAILRNDDLNCQLNNVTARAYKKGNSIKEYIKELVSTAAFQKKMERN